MFAFVVLCTNYSEISPSELPEKCFGCVWHCVSVCIVGTDEEEGVKSKKAFRSQSVVAQNPETELMLEGDDDAVSLLQEKEIDNLAGNRGNTTRLTGRAVQQPSR